MVLLFTHFFPLLSFYTKFFFLTNIVVTFPSKIKKVGVQRGFSMYPSCECTLLWSIHQETPLNINFGIKNGTDCKIGTVCRGLCARESVNGGGEGEGIRLTDSYTY
jgi:hypothetical protein